MPKMKMTVEQELLFDVFNVIGSTTEKDIPNKKLREDIFSVWDRIVKYLEDNGVNLTY